MRFFFSWSTTNYKMAQSSRFKPGIYLSQGPLRCSIELNNVFKTHNNQTTLNGVNLIAHSGKM